MEYSNRYTVSNRYELVFMEGMAKDKREMSKQDTLEKRIEGLEQLLTLSIRVGEFHITRMIRETIKVAERELQKERIKRDTKE